MTRLYGLTAIALVLLGTACTSRDNATQVDLLVLQNVHVTPATATVRVGASLQLTAVSPDLPGVPIQWASGDTAVAVVSQLGVLAARRQGDVVITASYKERAGASQVTVSP
ncbi:hypothetical protein BH11GEM1_BH11GEM1_00910 [soil metagenome]